MTSNSCVRSGAVTEYTAPNSLLMIRSSVRENLTNEDGFRHTIVSAITQLLNISPGFKRSASAVACWGVTLSYYCNRGANPKALKNMS
jgi:hypothetical protein